MDKKFQNLHTDEWLKEIPLPSEARGYKPVEMITCKKPKEKIRRIALIVCIAALIWCLMKAKAKD